MYLIIKNKRLKEIYLYKNAGDAMRMKNTNLSALF